MWRGYRKRQGFRGGSISIGYIHTQGRRFIPELVRGFLNEQEGKKIDFRFQNAATGSLIRGLKEEKFDVIFCSRAEGEKEISFVPVSEEKLVAVVLRTMLLQTEIQ